MPLDLDRLEAALEEVDADGYLVVAAGDEPVQRYLSGFDAPDPFATLFEDGEIHLLVRGLERTRAADDSRATTVSIPADYGFRTLLENYDRPVAEARLHERFLRAFECERLLVPVDFPLGLADHLREARLDVRTDDRDIVAEMRAVKTEHEQSAIARAQRATERAMQAAIDRLRAAEIDENGDLTIDGDIVRSESIRRVIDRTLLEEDCRAEETIVAGGAQAADPHQRGTGPLSANEAIVIDIFPEDRTSGYHADMTRTVVVGEPPAAIERMFAVVKAALEAAQSVVEPGVSADTVHAAACDVIEEAGYPTLRTDEDTDSGFIHGTGHGVGLAVHEAPSLNESDHTTLEPGHVITIEPGLYEPDVGGVRLENLLLVTAEGHERFTDFPLESRLEPSTC